MENLDIKEILRSCESDIKNLNKKIYKGEKANKKLVCQIDALKQKLEEKTSDANKINKELDEYKDIVLVLKKELTKKKTEIDNSNDLIFQNENITMNKIKIYVDSILLKYKEKYKNIEYDSINIINENKKIVESIELLSAGKINFLKDIEMYKEKIKVIKENINENKLQNIRLSDNYKNAILKVKEETKEKELDLKNIRQSFDEKRKEYIKIAENNKILKYKIETEKEDLKNKKEDILNKIEVENSRVKDIQSNIDILNSYEIEFPEWTGNDDINKTFEKARELSCLKNDEYKNLIYRKEIENMIKKISIDYKKLTDFKITAEVSEAEYKEKILSIEITCQKITEDNARLFSVKNKAEDLNEKLRNINLQLTNDIDSKVNNISILESKIEEMSKEIERLNNSTKCIDDMKNIIYDLKTKIAESCEIISNLSDKVIKLEYENERIPEMKKYILNAENELNYLNSTNRNYVCEIKKTHEIILNNESEIKKYKELITKKEEEIESVKIYISQLETHISSSNVENKKNRELIVKNEEEIESLKPYVVELETHISNLNLEHKKYIEDIKIKSDFIKKKENENEYMKQSIINLENKISLEIDDVTAVKKLTDDLDEYRKKLLTTENELTRYVGLYNSIRGECDILKSIQIDGDININEYKSMKEMHELSKQKIFELRQEIQKYQFQRGYGAKK